MKTDGLLAFPRNTKYYRVVDSIRNFEQIPWRVIAVRLVDVFGNDASATVEVK